MGAAASSVSLPLGSQVLGLLQSALCFSPVHLATESPAEPEPVVPPSAVVKRGKTRGENLPNTLLNKAPLGHQAYGKISHDLT